MSGPFRILYLTHDVSDPASHRRVRMMKDGGAQVTVAGFRRAASPVREVAGCPVIDFGRTYNGGFAQRLWALLRELAGLSRHRALFAGADLILARNLEMLALGVRGKALAGQAPALVYESLDIHRLLLAPAPIGPALRRLEGWLAGHAAALLTSSPAFIRAYFHGLASWRLPVRLVENRLYLSGDRAPQPAPALPAPPWRIGWFGALRCRKSLEILRQLVQQSDGRVEVILRGRPARELFEDFDGTIARTPGLSFHGTYHNPQDLAAIYGEVHFCWAVDRFEEGQNSSWLLPNRLYESGAYGVVPMAETGVETGRYLQARGIGVLMPVLEAAWLQDFFHRLTGEQYDRMKVALAQVPRDTWMDDIVSATALVQYLQAVRSNA